MMKIAIIGLLCSFGTSIASAPIPHTAPPPSIRHLSRLLSVDAPLTVIATSSQGSVRTNSHLTGKTPLKEALADLQPKAVWENFYALTRIPRPSHHEQQVSQFLAGFGRGLGLETIVDSVGNVLIRKHATISMTQRQGIALQAHMDMVVQTTPDKKFEAEKNPIEAFLEGGLVKADRTSLGADNGIGIAMIMAILQAKDLAHGPIEALFTVDEESDATGISALRPGVLKSNLLINLDSETEGTLIIGSAGGVSISGSSPYQEFMTPVGMTAYRLSVMGLRGGHSGLDINRGRGNAGRVLVRLITEIGPGFGARVARLEGGDRYGVIPREATANIVVPTARADSLEKYIREFERTRRNELAVTEPGLAVRAIPCSLPTLVMDEKAQRDLFDAAYSVPNGVIRMSDALPDLVETSCSMGILKAENGQFGVGIQVRSSVDSSRDDIAERLLKALRLGGMEAATADAYSGWRPNPKSVILELMKQSYLTQFGYEPIITALHAGLETAAIAVKYPKMDMISIGPTIMDVHSPNEQVEVVSVKKAYDLLVESLRRIP